MPDLNVTANVQLQTVRGWLQSVWNLPRNGYAQAVQDATNRDQLHEDYAAICHFLSTAGRN